MGKFIVNMLIYNYINFFLYFIIKKRDYCYINLSKKVWIDLRKYFIINGNIC